MKNHDMKNHHLKNHDIKTHEIKHDIKSNDIGKQQGSWDSLEFSQFDENEQRDVALLTWKLDAAIRTKKSTTLGYDTGYRSLGGSKSSPSTPILSPRGREVRPETSGGRASPLGSLSRDYKKGSGEAFPVGNDGAGGRGARTNLPSVVDGSVSQARRDSSKQVSRDYESEIFDADEGSTEDDGTGHGVSGRRDSGRNGIDNNKEVSGGGSEYHSGRLDFLALDYSEKGKDVNGRRRSDDTTQCSTPAEVLPGHSSNGQYMDSTHSYNTQSYNNHYTSQHYNINTSHFDSNTHSTHRIVPLTKEELLQVASITYPPPRLVLAAAASIVILQASARDTVSDK
jgi:hypothetical protein